MGAELTEPLLRSGQVAELLGVSVWTVHNMVADGRLTAVAKLDGSTGAYLFTPSAVAAAAERASSPAPVEGGDAA